MRELSVTWDAVTEWQGYKGIYVDHSLFLSLLLSCKSSDSELSWKKIPTGKSKSQLRTSGTVMTVLFGGHWEFKQIKIWNVFFLHPKFKKKRIRLKVIESSWIFSSSCFLIYHSTIFFFLNCCNMQFFLKRQITVGERQYDLRKNCGL